MYNYQQNINFNAEQSFITTFSIQNCLQFDRDALYRENVSFHDRDLIRLKTIAIMTSQTQNFLIFWLLILDSKSFQIII